MYKTFSQRNRAAYSVRIVCGLLFILFCMVFLYAQSPLLEALQHVLSGGKTSYSPIWGTIIITLVLCILQAFVSYFIRFVEYGHALSYLPSFLILAFLTDKDRSIYQAEYADSYWGWILIICALIYAFLIWANQKWLPLLITQTRFPDLASKLWPNVLIFNILSLFILSLSNLDPAFHCETKIESLIRRGQYKQAYEVGKKIPSVTSRELTALRAYALSRMDSLSNCLFKYPQRYQAEGLLLNTEVRTTSMKAEDLYDYLGDSRLPGESALHYLSRICLTETGSHPALDYYLCALLLEKQLDLFAQELQALCHVDDSLPTHYKEALILYRHRHGEYPMPFDATRMEQDYQQFLLHQDAYPNTYWWYYFHTKASSIQ